MRRARNRQSGFTLIELMVAVFVSASVIVTAFAIVLNTERSWDASMERKSSVQNLRAALQMLSHDVRMAGSGYGGETITTGGVPGGRLFPLMPRAGVNAPDTLILVGGLEGNLARTTSIMASPSDVLQVEAVDEFAVGDLVVIVDTDNADLFQLTSVTQGANVLGHEVTSGYNTPTEHDDWPVGGYPVGSIVAKVQIVRYWVDDSSGSPKLFRQLGSGTPVPLAEGIQDLQIVYVMADGTLDADPADPSLIRSVQIGYTSTPEHGSTEGDFIEITIAPRSIG